MTELDLFLYCGWLGRQGENSKCELASQLLLLVKLQVKPLEHSNGYRGLSKQLGPLAKQRFGGREKRKNEKRGREKWKKKKEKEKDNRSSVVLCVTTNLVGVPFIIVWRSND